MNKINLVSLLKFGYFGLCLEINITDPNFNLIFQKCMHELTDKHYVHLKLDTRIFFYCLLDLQFAKYGISSAQKGHLNTTRHDCENVFNHKFKFSLFSYN